MKLYISLDMEGMAGICQPVQQTEDRAAFREALHMQLGWLIEGIQRSERNDEITDIVVADSHGEGTNLVYSQVSAMDPRISLVAGSPRRTFMMAGLDATFDACIFVGYHAGPGHERANMDHAFSGKVVDTLRVNGVVMNESTVNAALAGDFGVPVALVIGDSGLREELLDEGRMPWVEYVETKRSLSNCAAVFRPMEAIRADTIAAVGRVLSHGSDLATLPRYTMAHPCELAIRFRRTIMADEVAQVPGTTRVDGLTVSIPCRDMSELACGISALTTLAGCM